MPPPPNSTGPSLVRLLDELTTLVSKAAAAILAVDAANASTRIKPDRSPVTAADTAAEAVILDGLARLLPGVPVVAEEAEKPATLAGATFVLVDPLDGTREYLTGHAEYTVNIALVQQGVPVLGCIGAPALGQIWRGAAGGGAERLDLAAGADVAAYRSRAPIRTRPMPAQGPAVAVSRSHLDPRTEQLLARIPHARPLAGGSSLKFCRLAEGAVDLYPRLAPTSEWDVAAGHAIVVAAGGAMVQPNGEALLYGRRAGNFQVPEFLAVGDPAALAQMRRLLRN